MLFTRYGQAVRFNIGEVRSTGRASYGVIGMTLDDGDKVIAMQLTSQGDSALIVSEKGLGKCTEIKEFPLHHRGGKGVRCYKITDKTGYVVGVKVVTIDDEMMLINTSGIIIRIEVKDTALQGRVTSGVKLINLKDNEKVASIAKVRKEAIVEEDEKKDDDGTSDETAESVNTDASDAAGSDDGDSGSDE